MENVVDGVVVTKTPVDFFIRLGSGSTNQQPVFVAPTPADGSVITGNVGALLSFGVAATDPDTGDTVTLGMLGQPAGSSFSPTAGNPASGTFSWTPTTPGDYLITLDATDQQGLGAVPRGIILRIGTTTVNQQPVFVAPTPADGSVITGSVGAPLSFGVAATDPDTGDTVTLGMLGQPAGSSFSPTAGNPASGTFSWTPTAPGDYPITLTATDQHGLAAVPRAIILRIAAPPPTGIIVSGQGRVQHRGGPCELRGLERHGVPRPARGIKFTFTGDVDTITGAGSTATLTGTGSYNGVSGHTFAITVGDNGAPRCQQGHDRRRHPQCCGCGRVQLRPRAPQERQHRRNGPVPELTHDESCRWPPRRAGATFIASSLAAVTGSSAPPLTRAVRL